MIGGFIPCSLLDYPGRTAAVIFLRGCNLRCRYCHNPELCTPEGEAVTDRAALGEFLERRRGRLGGVVVTGGEPTSRPDLADLLEWIRSFGYPVKLDTNGTRPERVRSLAGAGLLDYAAVDVKTGPESPWAQDLLGRGGQAEKALETLGILLREGVPCEARTTVVEGYHGEDELESLAAALAAAGVGTWWIQPVRGGKVLDPDRTFRPPPADLLARVREFAAYLGLEARIRGNLETTRSGR